jgi:hypothetical protein
MHDGVIVADSQGRPILCAECPCADQPDCGFMAQETFARIQIPSTELDPFAYDEVIAMSWGPNQWDGSTTIINECSTPFHATVLCDADLEWKLTIQDRIEAAYTPPTSEGADEITWNITFHELTCSGPAGGGDYAGTLTMRKDGTDPWS